MPPIPLRRFRNPINDAEAMAKALEGAGFKVIMETNADQAKMVRPSAPSAPS